MPYWIIEDDKIEDIVDKNNDFGSFENGGEELLLKRALEGKKNPVVFDIGCNEGFYIDAVLANTSDSDIHAFEPLSKCFKVLKAMYPDSISLNNYAVSNYVGEATINFAPYDDSGLSSIKKEVFDPHSSPKGRVELSGKEIVKTITLEKYINDNGIKHIDFMKIDVEGSEVDVIKGLGSFRDIDYIQFEYSSTYRGVATLKDMFDLLSPDFIIAKVLPIYISVCKYDERLENYKHCNYVAINKRLCSTIS